MMPKAWYSSKTLWFNGLSLLIAVAVGFGYGDHEIDPMTSELAALLITVVNIGLRFWTSKPIIGAR